MVNDADKFLKEFDCEVENPTVDTREKIIKDIGGRSASDLCVDLSDVLRDKQILFFRPTSRKIVEIGNIKIKSSGEDMFTGFLEVGEKRFITLIEKYVDVGFWKKTREGEFFETQSLSPGKSGVVLSSHIIEEALPQIQRIFPGPIPIIHEGKLTFPKKGYDKRFDSWRNMDSIDFLNDDMPLDEAKKIIDDIYSEFCFGCEQDKINAIAGLLTPFLRGVFNDFNTITPVFFYLGNREGVGKDCCGAIPSLVMDGSFQQDTPICDGGKVDDTELRKKITSAIRFGRKRMHFANNKGYLNSTILEKLITDPWWVDRVLGKTEEMRHPNELDLSLSGNIPIRYSDDLERRTIFINLFYAEENINARKFERPDLHAWIIKNRGLILSALFSLVRNWIDNEKPKSSIPFSSFNHWADVCGGIMECAGYGSPCVRDSSNKILSGDSDSDEMKELFGLCYEKFQNRPVKKREIVNIIKEHGEIFSYFDFEKRADQTRFSKKLRIYLGRNFNNVKMNIFNKGVRSDKQEFIFSGVGGLRGHGDSTTLPTCERERNIYTIQNVPNVPEVPNKQQDLPFSKEDIEKTGDEEVSQ